MALVKLGEATTSGRADVGVRVRKLDNGKDAGTVDFMREIIKGGSDRGVDWIWRLCNMTFESAVVPEDGRSFLIVPLFEGKEERTEYKNYRGISVVEKICAGVRLIMNKRASEQGRGVGLDLHPKADR